MDNPSSGGENPGMAAPGEMRSQLSSTLTAAYGRGLLSEHTFAARLECVLRDPVLDPERLVGDLYLRDPEGTLRDRVAQTMATVLSRVEALLADSDRLPPALLGLDWTEARGELLVGRSSRCDVVLADSSVSRHHARLHARDGRWTLEDLASMNGTSLNGRRVGRCELRPGDRLAFGCLELRVD